MSLVKLKTPMVRDNFYKHILAIMTGLESHCLNKNILKMCEKNEIIMESFMKNENRASGTNNMDALNFYGKIYDFYLQVCVSYIDDCFQVMGIPQYCHLIYPYLEREISFKYKK